MTYATTNTIADVQTLLREVLAPYLGTFNNGRSAIAVEPPAVPSSGTGLHVYIQRQPVMISGNNYKWVVTMVMYGDDWIKWDGAIAAMRSRFARRTEAIMPYSEGYLARTTFGLVFERFAYHQY